jgi:hypothetical protein
MVTAENVAEPLMIRSALQIPRRRAPLEVAIRP